MKDIELYKKARRRVENKNRGKVNTLTDKDIIIDQEKEIEYYRQKIQNLTNKEINKRIETFDNEYETIINGEDYLIKYNKFKVILY